MTTTITSGLWAIVALFAIGAITAVALLQKKARAGAARAFFDERELFRTTLARIGDAVVASDLNCCVTFLSPVAEQLTGWSTADAKGKPLDTVVRLLHEDSRTVAVNPSTSAARNDEIVGLSNHTILVSLTGAEWHIEDMAAPVHDSTGGVSGAVLIFRDISARRATELKMSQFVAELSDRDHRNTEFLAVLAHELRNPLAPIRSALEVMRVAPNDASAVSSARQVLGRQVGQMVHLVDDLLDVSRITRGSIELHCERIALATVLRMAVDTALPQLNESGVAIHVSQPPTEIMLDADPIRLTQAISNVLNNAAKFTNRGGQVWLTATVEKRDVVIGIRDNGIGVAADQRERIFEMFTQVDGSLERARDGLGIGLTLVRTLLTLHGGSVEVQSAGLGQGSEFTLRLPRERSHEFALKTSAPVSSAPTRSLRILVVDDNHDSADSLAVVLRLTGHQVQVAYDGVAGVVAAERFAPDVILLDVGMPKLNGYDAARRIRETAWGVHITLIALTGWGQETDRARSAAAGFNVHLVKPVDFAALTKLLSEVPTAAAHSLLIGS